MCHASVFVTVFSTTWHGAIDRVGVVRSKVRWGEWGEAFREWNKTRSTLSLRLPLPSVLLRRPPPIKNLCPFLKVNCNNNLKALPQKPGRRCAEAKLGKFVLLFGLASLLQQLRKQNKISINFFAVKLLEQKLCAPGCRRNRLVKGSG